LQIDVAETAVEQNLTGVQFEEQTQLRIVDHGVASEVQERIVEVGQSLFKVAQEEIGNSLLEVGDCEILIKFDSTLIALDL
jgi:hypothetical protein